MVCLGDDLVYSDVPCAWQMLELFREVGESIVAVQRVAADQTYQYGIVEGIDNREEPVGRHKSARIAGKFFHFPDQLFAVGKKEIGPLKDAFHQ